MVRNFWRRFLGFMEPASDSESLADGLDDMIFFERRLNEVITGMHPKAMKWIVFLLLTFAAFLVAAYYWIVDPSIRYVTFYESLWRHPFFTIGFLALIFLFTFCGIQRRVIAPSIIAARCRSVLVDFYLSCDERGRLIVRPTHDYSIYS